MTLENELRAMMRERAGDITTVPERVFDMDVPAAHQRPARRWTHLLAVAAAVVSIIAVAAAVFGLQSATQGRKGDPASPGPSAPPTTAVKAAGCVVPLPDTWRTFFEARRLRVDQPVNVVVAAHADDLLLVQGTPNTAQTQAIYDHQELAVFGKDGRGETVFVVDAARKSMSIDAAPNGALTDRWVVFGLRGAQNLGGSSELWAYDRQTQQLRELAKSPDPGQVAYSPPVIVGDSVYWLARKWNDDAATQLWQRALDPTGPVTPVDTPGPLGAAVSLDRVGPGLALVSTSNHGALSIVPGPGLTIPMAVVRAFSGAGSSWADGDTLGWHKAIGARMHEFRWTAGSGTVSSQDLGPVDDPRAMFLSPTGATVRFPDGMTVTRFGDEIAVTVRDGKLGPSYVSRAAWAELPAVTC